MSSVTFKGLLAHQRRLLGTFLAVFLERLSSWWSPAQGFTNDEVVNFDFSHVLIRSRIQKRMEHTEQPVLKAFALRAKFVMNS